MMQQILIKGIAVGRHKVELTHLHFVDDTLLFVPDDDRTLVNYRRLLKCFSLMTGLKVNYSESCLVSWKNDHEWLANKANILHYSKGKLPMT